MRYERDTKNPKNRGEPPDSAILTERLAYQSVPAGIVDGFKRIQRRFSEYAAQFRTRKINGV